MTGEERRNRILTKLMESQEPMSGAALAKAFRVSRQVIVQDIALMRAERYDIMSTNKGYLYRNAEADTTFPKRVFFVKHTTEQVLEEFLTVIELGGRVLDVAVEHELYGQIRVDLLIESRQDAVEFAEKLSVCRDNLLKVLDLVEAELKQKGMLL